MKGKGKGGLRSGLQLSQGCNQGKLKRKKKKTLDDGEVACGSQITATPKVD